MRNTLAVGARRSGLLGLLAVVLCSPRAAGAQAAPSGSFGLALEYRGRRPDQQPDTTRRVPAIIARIWAGGPADQAALSAGDTVLALNGAVMDAVELRRRLAATPVGATVAFLLGTPKGRFTVQVRKRADPLQPAGRDSLPLRYRGRLGDVDVDVLTRDAPLVSRDSTGALLIRVGGHAIRLRERPAGVPVAPR